MKKYRKKTKNRYFVALFCLIIAIFSYSLIEPYLIEEKTTIIQNENIPENFSGKKIVFVSDIHHGRFFSKERVADVVSRINQHNPDIIILGGDYVYGDEKYIEPCFEELSKLEAPLGVYAITGNHDEWENYELTIENIKKYGITALDGSEKEIYIEEEKISLEGIGWNSTVTENEILLKQADPEEFSILVAHDPGLAEELDISDIDLMLSGHNHGGQITLFGLWAFYLPSDYGQKYRTGIVEKGNTKILISNGVGNTFIPVRFFARPQINTVILEK